MGGQVAINGEAPTTGKSCAANALPAAPAPRAPTRLRRQKRDELAPFQPDAVLALADEVIE
jgi:hypothetical protein